MTQLPGPFLCGALLGWVCLSAPGLAVEVEVPAEPLSVPLGKTAELTCSYSTSVGENFALEWSFVQPGRPISASQPILYFTNGQLYPTGSKAERASLLHNPPTGGVASLKLTDVRPSDTGTYLCHVNNPPDFYTNGLGLINLTVLVPPSRPWCSHSGQTSVGGSAALRCSSSKGAPRPVYNWVRLGSSSPPSPGSMVQDEVTGQLILTNLSLASAGTYRCLATNQMGSASCELTLSVTDPSKGRVAGALIGVLLGVLFLSVAVFCLRRFQKERRKKRKEIYGGSDLRPFVHMGRRRRPGVESVLNPQLSLAHLCGAARKGGKSNLSSTLGVSCGVRIGTRAMFLQMWSSDYLDRNHQSVLNIQIQATSYPSRSRICVCVCLCVCVCVRARRRVMGPGSFISTKVPR
ncbi:V-set and immunoglobulin domain-containing protein 2 isoform X1 [Camelus ferus]|uniref:V-set and immunoglobulin domain-containing protein 2 isoform X1 n=1 Tax=Camelus bactrianus TaxID=9837 RepID=UPI00057A65F6|nr:V-set and immunoglobulin domain-containing protein 2 isoform X1 [Camelus bactrianus]XP_014420841.1 V-set and immunoglobulin domain-containing protein 2 isoform X1 [Camelus ferus]